MSTLVMGIDVGTQGVRALVTDLKGNCVASESVSFSTLNTADTPNLKEQNPEDWWDAAQKAIVNCVAAVRAKRMSADDIRALSVDATSGTILALDKNNNALSAGLMYNDPRSACEANEIREFAAAMERMLGYRVNSSFGLPKIVWMSRKSESKARRYAHQQDFIIGRLSGEYGITDYSNALKTCYDLVKMEWPAFFEKLGISADALPKVVAPGTPVGLVQSAVAQKTGLSKKTIVVAGATDGYASALSAGISKCGDWASIIGTTMVMKGIVTNLVNDEHGRIYSHLHPEGYWLLGGASNVGGKCLNECVDKNSFDEYNVYAEELTPTGIGCYPLSDTGERFPFLNLQAQGFLLERGLDKKREYTALMEGVGYTERLAFELLCALGCEMQDEIYTAGGACNSDIWLQIRSDILGKTLKIPEQTDAVMGTALLASLAVGYDCLAQASENMIKIKKTVHPSKYAGRYEEGYLKTKSELERRGYLL